MADNPYLAALGEAQSHGYTHDEIATYHASQGWQAPAQPQLNTLMMSPGLGGGQYDDPAAQAYARNQESAPQNTEVVGNDKSVETYSSDPNPALANKPYNPVDAAAEGSPTNVKNDHSWPTTVQPGDYVPPATADTDQEGGLAPWEVPNPNGVGSYVPPPQEQGI